MMAKAALLSCIAVLISLPIVKPQGVGWTWMAGTKFAEPDLNTGVKYQFSADTNPSCLFEGSMAYSQVSKVAYVYGSWCYGPFDSFWAFNRTSTQWALMGGNVDVDQEANFAGGIKGRPSPIIYPGSLADAFSYFDDLLQTFGMFGGMYAGGNRYRNDLWAFEVATTLWTWIGGAGETAVDGIANYGTNSRHVYQAEVWPGARAQGAFSWDNSTRRFFVIGGYGYAGIEELRLHSDVWSYKPDLGQWAWHSGSQLGNQAPNFGRTGAFGASTVPGGRVVPGSYFDPLTRRLFMFGGFGYSQNGAGDLSDLWEYGVDLFQWKYLGGPKTIVTVSDYGRLLVASPSNVVHGREWPGLSFDPFRSRIYVFGGFALDSGGNYQSMNDYWEFSLNTTLWRWLGGSRNSNQPGRYGQIGVFSNANTPGGKAGPSMFFDTDSRQLWIFGGLGADVSGNFGYVTDVWRFQTPTIREDFDKGNITDEVTTTEVLATRRITTAPPRQGPQRVVGSAEDQSSYFSLNNPGVVIGLSVAVVVVVIGLIYVCVKSAARKSVADAIVLDPMTSTTMMMTGTGATFMGVPPAGSTFMGLPPAGSTFMGMPPQGATFMGFQPQTGTFMGFQSQTGTFMGMQPQNGTFMGFQPQGMYPVPNMMAPQAQPAAAPPAQIENSEKSNTV